MKSIYKLFFLVLVVTMFVSCQDDIVEIVEPSQEEVLKANAKVTNLVQKTVTKDGSKDNIIDKSSCTEVELPITVSVNGLEIIIDSEEDFEVIEAIFDEFHNDIDNLEIFFPITVVLSDYTKITINNFDEFEAIISECEDENELDDDIECLDFVYPIDLSIYDSKNQLVETVTVENDEQFYKFVNNVDEYDVVVVNFPIWVVLFNGNEVKVEDMTQLENIIEEVKDACDEDDDNDYDDDDCEECTEDEIKDLLMTCQWEIDYLFVNGVEQTEQYTYYKLWFKEEGVVKAIVNNEYLYGEWEVATTDEGIIVSIAFDGLSDFSFDWRLYEIEDDNEIDLRYGDNKLVLEKECEKDSEDKQELIQYLNEGMWMVAKFRNNGNIETENFSDYDFDFKENNVVVVSTNEDPLFEGTWEAKQFDDYLKLVLNFGDEAPFKELNGYWKVSSLESHRIEVYMVNDNNTEDILVLEKREDTDEKAELIEHLNEGIWMVAKFDLENENITELYSEFDIDFKETNGVLATKGDIVIDGSWEVIQDDVKLKLALNFGEDEPFHFMNGDWIVSSMRFDRVEVYYVNENNEQSVLVFERSN